MPVISVIVPVYKVEEYLKPCTDSILAQSFSDFELILVDDGSPDQCGAICDEYAEQDHRIKVIHKENGGLSDARNKGIEAASGKYLAFIDSDDLVHKDYLRILYQLVTENNADISACRFETFKNKIIPDLNNSADNYGIIFQSSGKDACSEYYSMSRVITIEAWGKLYKKELFNELRFPFGKINEDNGTVPIALYNSDIFVLTDAPLYKYRIRSDSIMGRAFSSRRFDDVSCIQFCINYFIEKKEPLLVKQAMLYRDVTNAKLIIEAIAQNSKKSIPKQYLISEYKALRILRANSSDDLFCWYLSRIHPNWVRPYLYMNKITALFRKKHGR